jgi:adenine-specific DNA-methyltransferase
MKNNKLIGSFYTPKIIADFLVDYLSKKMKDGKLSILEPSSGDGIFIHAIYNHKTLSPKIKKVVAVEREEIELKKVREITKSKSLKTIHSDFLDFQNDNKQKFDLVIGNPPYIKKNHLEESQIKICEDIHRNASLANQKIKNLWTAFLVRCIEFTAKDGILAFVLPSELLQVKFAAELRELILNEFERVEIFTFNELLFKDCKGQDTLLLIGERKSKNKGIFYCNITELSELKNGNFSLLQNLKLKESKWTHSHLSNDEIELLEKLKNKIKTIDYYCSSKAGIVTAANDFFIVNNETSEKYSLNGYTKEIIQKGVFVNGSVEITRNDFNKLIKDNKPTYLLDFTKGIHKEDKRSISQYFDIGLVDDIHTRYKTSIREKWYVVPNIGNPPQGFFFKRCNEYPKLIKNSARVLSTDSAYWITMRDGGKIEDLIFSFYNSLTLSFAELNGRYYGGGVLELTPNEFKELPIPTKAISKNKFDSYVLKFEGKQSIKDICKKNDEVIIKSIDKDIDKDTINKLFSIREKLYLRRIKTN